MRFLFVGVTVWAGATVQPVQPAFESLQRRRAAAHPSTYKETSTKNGDSACTHHPGHASCAAPHRSAQQGRFRRGARIQQRVHRGMHGAYQEKGCDTRARRLGRAVRLGRVPQDRAHQPRKKSPHAGTGSREALAAGWCAPHAYQRAKNPFIVCSKCVLAPASTYADHNCGCFFLG